jgi:hypothetical protein
VNEDHTRETLRWLWSVFAKLLLAVFIAPFVLMGTAILFAIGTSQAGTLIGTSMAVGFVAGVAMILEHWLKLIPSRSDRSP